MRRKQICLRIREELNAKLIQIAEEEDVSKNKLIERELKRFVAKREKESDSGIRTV